MNLVFKNRIKWRYVWSCCIVVMVLLSAGFFTSCKKDNLNTSAGVQFSADTLTFDTLFTSLGSTTKFFTIRNNQKDPVVISSIQLASGVASSYRINVDGDSGTVFRDIEIPAKDSIYVFVEVTVDPNAADLPFLIMDSLQFVTNGRRQQVILQAYGQNAHFFNADSIENNTVWNNDLPYVILNYLQIKPGASLTINQGCTVYFGGGAAMIVEGDLTVNGTDTSNMVIFRGIRLDKDIANRPYDDFPGQYAGVFFLRNSTGTLRYLNMRNSAYGLNIGNIKASSSAAENVAQLQAMNLNNAPEVNIYNSRIYNHAFYGVFGFLGKVYAENSLFYSCGKNVLGIYNGGDYQFTNCTFYTRGSAYISHAKEPLFYMNNYFEYAPGQFIFADSSRADFNNCILYGTLEEEIVGQDASLNPHRIDLNFNHCIVKTALNISNSIFNNCKKDDPQFLDVFKNKFQLKTSSPAVDFSGPVFTNDDIDGFAISGASRDCGAYELQ